jgi:outer membrane protein TolC
VTRYSLVAAVLLLGGCTLGPNFAEPSLFAPSTWFASRPPPPPAPSQVVLEPIDAAWWQVFHDPILTELEEQVAASNLSVRLATVRLQESRLQRGVTAADEYPNANANGSYVREKIADRGVIGLLGGGGSSTSTATSANGLSGTQGGVPTTVTATSGGPGKHLPSFNLFQSGFDSTWELDFWGRVRRQVESADADIDASAEARRDSLVTVLAELARDYLQLRGQQRDLQIARDTLASEQQSLRITQERRRRSPAWRRRRPPRSTPSACCWGKRRVRYRPSCRRHSRFRRCRRRCRSGCPPNWRSAGRTSAGPRRNCIPRRPRSARRRLISSPR